jgi:putative endonuclease
MFVTYVLYSSKYEKIYIGYTSDLISRFHSHNELSSKGFTVHFRPWVVVLVSFHETKTQAMLHEKQLKTSRGRASIWNLININYKSLSGSYQSVC